MERDRSLEEFVGDAAEESGAGEPETESENGGAETESGDGEGEVDTGTRSGDADDGKAPIDDVEAATATYRWDPDGVECPACGNVADRLWSQDGRHVCVDCKDW
ncbi:DUF7573 domain-containing protein [Halobellus inordinatus]|uniref:DUF7573 domain-containing protein n=1 Tax=Halobellus inordinatus TaxID=1126236 RepID=UPI00210D73E7|nr:hypothetical protein [Halobellus inordinatus]